MLNEKKKKVEEEEGEGGNAKDVWVFGAFPETPI
jgi:hypothetical protein